MRCRRSARAVSRCSSLRGRCSSPPAPRPASSSNSSTSSWSFAIWTKRIGGRSGCTCPGRECASCSESRHSRGECGGNPGQHRTRGARGVDPQPFAPGGRVPAVSRSEARSFRPKRSGRRLTAGFPPGSSPPPSVSPCLWRPVRSRISGEPLRSRDVPRALSFAVTAHCVVASAALPSFAVRPGRRPIAHYFLFVIVDSRKYRPYSNHVQARLSTMRTRVALTGIRRIRECIAAVRGLVLAASD